ncbi:hypothetical protein EMCG_00290 [[Emmonsia] crescens]|uniref:Uncharacterized protein n=1 Tax=[Emmonsia] crescens TaxID=73230 RepID=A0A0G2HYB7_9EURO|nr:hypothetical protein EMCG_00290 [Emmonsia crescens UAMH 3008]
MSIINKQKYNCHGVAGEHRFLMKVLDSQQFTIDIDNVAASLETKAASVKNCPYVFVITDTSPTSRLCSQYQFSSEWHLDIFRAPRVLQFPNIDPL